MVAGRGRRERLVWAGYAAAAWGLLFAGFSFYWGSGSTLGLDTLGDRSSSWGGRAIQ